MKKRYFLILALLFPFAFRTYGQIPTIKIAQDPKIHPIVLQKLDIDVQIYGNVAITTMEMTFYNDNQKVLEGELTFPMPDGVTISSYALDVLGKMRQAVPVEKARAKEVFESIEHTRIDPGLLEKVEGNNFRTRIYPIPSKGTRKIRITYEEELKAVRSQSLRYHLPLDYRQQIENFGLKVTVFNKMMKPMLIEQPDGSFSLNPSNNVIIGAIKKEKFLPKKSLTIDLPKVGDMPEVLLQKAEDSYYFLVNVFPKQQDRKREWSNQIGVIWDCSLSGLQRDHDKELALLEHLVQEKRNLTIQLGLLNNNFVHGGTYVITNGNWSDLKKKLQQLTYDGGTDFSAINLKKLAANEYLFFTDGLSSFGPAQFELGRPVHTVSSSARADYSTLKYISLKSRGQFVNLLAADVNDAFKQLDREPFRFLGIKNRADVRQAYPSMPLPVDGHLAVAGILGRYGTSITLQFGYGQTVTAEQTVRLTADMEQLNTLDVSKIWAQKKIAEMDIDYEQHKAEITALGKQFGIVTRNTSLMVLERLDDYIRYSITPPAELRPQYEAILKQQRAQLAEQRKNLLDDAVAMSNTLKSWWKKDFYGKNKDKKEPIHFPQPVAVNDSTARAVAMPDQRREVGSQAMSRSVTAQSEMALHEVVVTSVRNEQAMRRTLQGRVPGVSVTSSQASTTTKIEPVIIVKEFRSDKDYMKELTGNGENIYQRYLLIRDAYVNTPMFYFDVSNLLYQQGDSARALLVLSNIADLEIENADLFKLLSYKLKQVGNFQKVLFITQKVKEWSPNDPQSYRDYALALADVGKSQQALDVLYEALLQTYNQYERDRDEGIEEVILPELNNIITRNKGRLNLAKIDRRLIANLPVDVRVVLNWNKKDTDIDLWLTDPNGEKCFYSNSTTVIGGRISNDFTDGYGPEQFMLKKAIHGKYKIEVNFYGDRQFTVSGPTTVMAEIFTRYSNGDQRRKLIVLPLEASNKEGNLVGEFTF